MISIQLHFTNCTGHFRSIVESLRKILDKRSIYLFNIDNPWTQKEISEPLMQIQAFAECRKKQINHSQT